MKSMVRLTLEVLKEITDLTGISTARDEITVTRRVEEEGLSFLTITLPAFEKDLLVSLAAGHISPNAFTGFRRRRGVPEFLGGLLECIFDQNGVLRVPVVSEDWGIQAELISHLRQFLLLLKKVEMATSPERVQRAYDQYKETDAAIAVIPPDAILRFRRMAKRLFSKLLIDWESTVYDLQTSYSGGALATRESFNGRFSSRVWTERLEQVLPHWDYLGTGWRDLYENADSVQILSQAEETPCRVTTVPKTMKTPRIIAMEPSWNNQVQQGLLREICSLLEKRKYAELEHGMYWEHQDYNGLLARIGSETGKLATVDLSEASDRVSNQLIRDGLLSSVPFLSQVIQACRSERASLPNGELIPLKKFASMGSALTFPLETMVFYTIIHLAWERTHGRTPAPLTPNYGVRVYGDDMVVPVSLVPSLLLELETYGLKVNREKSFWTGFFRESCGSDYYAGYPVRTVKLAHVLPTARHHVQEIAWAVEFANNLYERGYERTARYVKELVTSLRHVPSKPPGIPGIAFVTHNESEYRVRHSADLHKGQYRVLRMKSLAPTDPLHGYGALQKFFQPHEIRVEDHLERDGRTRHVGLIGVWA